ncbi:hypothetical protein [Marinilabilia salmonicolor]|uniref:hypothetical protein n=1 Tax=Marinilabilia salmonicolor TaxID=989 RepID=UPI00029B485F|nr:hypothetical protein [Marinilabilia salmonicolor]
MALVFKSKTENIEVAETHNDFSLMYRFQMKDGKLTGNLSGEARIDGRTVYYMSTHDGQNFNSNSNQQASDDLAGLNEKMKEDLVAVHADPLLYAN